MKGYLQRIAASAVRPVSGVHPVVRPLFASPADPFAGTDFLEDSTVTSPPVQRAESTPSPIASAQTRFVRPAAPEGTPRRPESPPEHTAVRSIGAPPEARRETAFQPLIEARAIPQADVFSATVEVRSAAPDASMDSVKELPAQSFDTRTQSEPSRLLAPRPNAPLPASRAFRRDARRAPAPPARSPEPDQIEIHIGRIEVTAVPRAVPRAAPKPARKSLNLDDYLRRSR